MDLRYAQRLHRKMGKNALWEKERGNIQCLFLRKTGGRLHSQLLHRTILPNIPVTSFATFVTTARKENDLNTSAQLAGTLQTCCDTEVG